jgi:GxxExxY protein
MASPRQGGQVSRAPRVSRGSAESAEPLNTSSQRRVERMDVDDVSAEIVDAAVKLHSRLGPGLLESVYHVLLVRALRERGLEVESRVAVPFEFDGVRFDVGLRLDLLVERSVVVEIKSAEATAPVHMKQLLTYLRLLDLRVGLLVNFGCATMKDGLRRVVNDHRPRMSGARLPSASN